MADGTAHGDRIDELVERGGGRRARPGDQVVIMSNGLGGIHGKLLARLEKAHSHV